MGRTRKRQGSKAPTSSTHAATAAAAAAATAAASITAQPGSLHPRTGGISMKHSFASSFMNDDEKWSIHDPSIPNEHNCSYTCAYNSRGDNGNNKEQSCNNHNKQKQKQHSSNNNHNNSRLLYSSLRRRARGRTPFKLPSSASASMNMHMSMSIPMLLYQRQINSFGNKFIRMKQSKEFLVQNYNYNIHTNQEEKNHESFGATTRSTITNSISTSSKRRKHYSNHHHCYKQIATTIAKQQWKPSMKRIIPFSKLNTPLNDAILGIDHTGSFFISVADGQREREYYHGEQENYHGEHLLLLGRRTNERGDGSPRTRIAEVDASFFGDATWIHNHEYEYEHRQYHHIPPSLSLRFYAVPSPASLEYSHGCIHTHTASKTNTEQTCPHVCSIPLCLTNSDCIDREVDSTLSTSFSVSNTRIQILLSRSSDIGVAFVHHTTGEDASSSITIFQIPSCSYNLNKRYIEICRCARIRIGDNARQYTVRNLLWPTTVLPQRNNLNHCYPNGMLLCDELRKTSHGHVLFNDEDDGYRIFWIESGCNLHNNKSEKVEDLICGEGYSRLQIRPQRQDIVECCDYESFEKMLVDPRTGFSLCGTIGALRSNDCSINEVFEAYLHIDALLSDILYYRRKLMFNSSDVSSPYGSTINIPDFYYNIVSFNSTTGRSIIIVIAFVNPRHGTGKTVLEENLTTRRKRGHQQQPASYAVVIEIDLIDQSYSELDWIMHPTKWDSAFLRKWVNDLASLRRMKEMNIGPSCAGEMSMSSLYGYCDVFSNNAVICNRPLSQFKSLDFPIEVKYF